MNHHYCHHQHQHYCCHNCRHNLHNHYYCNQWHHTQTIWVDGIEICGDQNPIGEGFFLVIGMYFISWFDVRK